jgi:hypothetical protein
MKPRPPTEKQLQRMILDYWRGAGLPGTRVAAIPNAGALGQSGLTRGLPDLLAYGPHVRGAVLFIELKTAKGTLSDYQKQIHAEMDAIDVSVVVCRSFEEAHDVLVNWRICKPLAHLERRA